MHAIAICHPAFKQDNNVCKWVTINIWLSPHALQGFTGVVAVDPSLDRNMIHQCTYTRQCMHTITDLQGVVVLVLLWWLIGSRAKVEDLYGYTTHSYVLGRTLHKWLHKISLHRYDKVVVPTQEQNNYLWMQFEAKWTAYNQQIINTQLKERVIAGCNSLESVHLMQSDVPPGRVEVVMKVSLW